MAFVFDKLAGKTTKRILLLLQKGKQLLQENDFLLDIYG
jgi:hypothetical protein